jgi:hypothetical protein
MLIDRHPREQRPWPASATNRRLYLLSMSATLVWLASVATAAACWARAMPEVIAGVRSLRGTGLQYRPLHEWTDATI